MAKFLTFLFLSSATASALPGVTYHGRLISPAGTPVVAPVVTFKIQIRTSGTEDCLLYEEEQTADLSQSNGMFALNFGDNPANRRDTTGFSFDRIFSNQGVFSLPGHCAVGNSYTPGSADNRRIVVSFNDGSFAGWEPMPSQNINFVPTTLESLRVGGFTAKNLLRVEDSAVPQDVSSVTSAQFTELMNLILGTSSQYTKSGQLNGTSLPAMANGQSLGWNGSAWSAVTPLTAANLPVCSSGEVVFSNGSLLTCVVDSTAGTALDATTTTKGVVQISSGGGIDVSTGVISLSNAGTAGTYYKVTTDAKGRVISGVVALAEADIPTLSTAGKVSGSAITSGTIAGNTSVSTTGNIQTTGDITSKRTILYDHSGAGPGYVGLQPASDMGGVNYTLTFPLTAGTAGQVLGTTNTSGSLAWTNPVATDLSTIVGTGIVQRNGVNSYGTVNVLSPLSYTGGNLGLNAGAGGVLLDGGNTITSGSVSAGTVSNHNFVLKTNNLDRVTIDSIGNVGIGTTSPSYRFHLTDNRTETSGSTLGSSWTQMNLVPATASNGFFYASTQQARYQASVNSPSATMVGATAQGLNDSNQTVGVTYGLNAMAINTSTSAGTINTAYGVRSNVGNTGASTGTVGSAYSGYFTVSNPSGTVNNAYGVYTGTIAGTNKYSIFASDATAPSYFAGVVGIGTTAPAKNLHVDGASTPTLRFSEGGSTTNFSDIYSTGGSMGIQTTVASGAAQMDLSSIVSDGTSGAGVRVFRNTNTTGLKRFSIMKGDGTGTVDSQITVGGNSYFNLSGGNIGIGTASPTEKLEVNGIVKATSFIGSMVSAGSSNTAGYTINSDTDSAGTDGGINLQVRGSTKFAVTDSGRVVVGGATTPPSLLANTNTNTVDGSGTGSSVDSLTWLTNLAGYVQTLTNSSTAATANGLFVKTTGVAATNRILNLNANGTDVMVVTGQGNVGIGTTGPNYSAMAVKRRVLTIAGDGSASDAFGMIELANPSGTASNNTVGAVAFVQPNNSGSVRVSQITGETEGAGGANGFGGTVRFFTKGDNSASLDERMRIDSSGSVGVGATNPRGKLNIYGTGQITPNIDTTTGDLSNMLVVQSSNILPGDGGGVVFGTRTVGGATDGLWAAIKGVAVSGSNYSAGDLVISTRTLNTDTTLTEKVRFAANGNVGIGTSTPANNLHVLGSQLLQTFAGGAWYGLQRTNGTAGAPTTVADTDYLGTIAFRGYNGTDNRSYASISGIVNGTVSGTTVPTDLFFSTGSSGQVERMRIDSGGNVGIGTSTPTVKLDVNGVVKATGFSGPLTSTGYTQSTGNFAMSGTGTFSTGTGAVSLNGDTTIAAGKNLTLASGTGTMSQTYSGTGTASSVVGTPGSSGNLMSLSTTSTAAVNNDKALNISVSGANASASITRYGVFSSVTSTGATSTNVAGYFSASGATNNYGLLVPNGKVVVGALSTYQTDGSIVPRVQVHGTSATDSALSLTSWLTGANNPGSLVLGHSKSATVGTNTIVADGDALGGIYFNGDDGTGFKRGASIEARVDGTPGTNDMPTRLIFSTSANGSVTPSERMRIDSGGYVGVGTTAPASELHVSTASGSALRGIISSQHSTDNNGSLIVGRKSRGPASSPTAVADVDSLFFLVPEAYDGTAYLRAGSAGFLVDGTVATNTVPSAFVVRTTTTNGVGTERMRISPAGNVGIGTTLPSTKLDVSGTVRALATYEGAAVSTNSSTAYTIPDVSTNVRRISLTGNTTITLPTTSTIPADSAYSLTVRVIQDATGGRTLGWAGNGNTIKWESGSAPAPSSGASKATIYTFTFIGGESIWYASQVWFEN